VHERDVSSRRAMHAASFPRRLSRVRVARAMDRTWRPLALRRDARRARAHAQ